MKSYILDKTVDGNELVHLRKATKFSQAELATKMGVDQSSVSRLESDSAVPEDDARNYLSALEGHPAAEEFLAYIDSNWQFLEKPAFRHPCREDLRQADEALTKLRHFVNDPTTPANLAQQAKMYESDIKQHAAFLADVQHTFSFVGNIMVGKTLALCAIAGLLIEGAKTLKQRAALEIGGGWTTLCEVQIAAKDFGSDEVKKFGLMVYPHSHEEIWRFVSDVCVSLFAIKEGKESESRVSEEVERALRSMADLARKPAKDGVIEDPLLSLIETYNTPEKLTAEFVSRMKLDERLSSDTWVDVSTIQEGLVWLQGEFRKINNGRHQKFSLPKRIDVIVPHELIKDTPYKPKFSDTKGVDGSPIRSDLQSYLDDPRSITVLCSRFAPDTTMMDLLAHLAATGKAATISEQILFLMLPRTEEALSINNEDGSPVDEVSEAYALREAQVRTKLLKFPGGKDIPVLFFNASDEPPEPIVKQFAKKLESLRAAHVDRLRELTAATEDLVSAYHQQKAQAAFANLRQRLRQFTQTYQLLPARTLTIPSRLLRMIGESHPRKVWASVRRNGDWMNLNSYLHAGVTANMDAKSRSDAALSALQTEITSMLADPEFIVIRNHMIVFQTNVAALRLNFLEEVSRRCQEIFRAGLFKEYKLWNECEAFWVEGAGFRSKVVEKVKSWLESKDHEWMQEAVEGIIVKDWQEFFISKIEDLAKEPPEA
jgi:transcriptional regulator with XRE-family HTH domain